MTILKNLKPDKVFFTSDTHFGHKAIMTYCKRPFSSVDEMNEKLVSNWNELVSDDCTVFHLGDFAFGGLPFWEDIRSRLRGHIILIKGNHDWRGNLQNLKRLETMFDVIELEIVINLDGQPIILNHYPLLCYSGSYNNSIWALHGHVHQNPNSVGLDTPRLIHRFPTQYDVGVDNNNYYPISYNQIKQIINKQIENENSSN